MLDPWSPGFAIDRHPHLERVLRRQAVKTQRRQQADDAGRHAARSLRQMLPFRARGPRETVKAATDAFEQASLEQPPKLGPGDSGALQVPRANDAHHLQ